MKQSYTRSRQGKSDVASHAEAWIERLFKPSCAFCVWSPPTRRRGLKPGQFNVNMAMLGVASHAEAWIETGSASSSLGG